MLDAENPLAAHGSPRAARAESFGLSRPTRAALRFPRLVPRADWDLGRPPRRGAGAVRDHFNCYTQRHCLIFPYRKPAEVVQRLKTMFRYNMMKVSDPKAGSPPPEPLIQPGRTGAGGRRALSRSLHATLPVPRLF